MPSVTHDGRSFMVDGRRVWLASGRIPYARIPRASWAARIAQAKWAGLNCVETPVFWNRHEVRAGRFDFTGDNDLRHFIDLCGKAGMFVILGLGPFVGAEWDFGGLPAYLREANGPQALRTNNQQFLEACSRFIGAVADQVRGWQVTAPGTGGPIILLQCESEWTCGHETLSAAYLGELTRYIREAGLSVPLVNSNNLWNSVEGQIDAWSGSEGMLATMRQLAQVRPEQPRLVIDMATGAQDLWGRESAAVVSARALQQRLAEVLAGGGQFNLTTFCGGTNFGFSGGRTDASTDTFAAQSADHGCALLQTGERGELYHAVRRIAHVASRFGRVFASLDPAFQPVAVRPGSPATGGRGKRAKAGKDAGSISVVHANGQQGGVAFLFAPEESGAEERSATLLLRDGTELHAPMGTMPVVWCLLDVNVSPKCHLDYSNLSALGASGTMLVVFGPAGARAQHSVNGSPVEAGVPRDDRPVVLLQEGLTIVIVRDEDADHTALLDDCVLLGVDGIDSAGQPVPPVAGAKQYLRVTPDGKVKGVPFEGTKRAAPRREKIALEDWSHASVDDYVGGTSPRYASIGAIAGLSTLGCPTGYGWYRLRFDGEHAGHHTLDFGVGGDRLHLFLDGKFSSIAGVGPGATTHADLTLDKEPHTLVVLADNLGRFCGGANLGDRKGLISDVYIVKPLRVGRSVRQVGNPVPLLGFRAPLWDIADGDATVSDRLTWTFKGKPKGAVLVRIEKPPSAGLLMLNDKPIAFIDRSGPTCIVVPDEQIGRGANVLQLTVVTPEQAATELDAAGESLTVVEAVGSLAENAELAFARWEVPASGAFEPFRAAALNGSVPHWFRCTFEASGGDDRGVFFEPIGLTKGQFYVNGKHAGRYFVATKSGRAVPPQERYFVPGSWLRVDEPNDLVFFDEHGASPTRVRVTR